MLLPEITWIAGVRRGLLMKRGDGAYWDSQRIGVGCPPIATEEGWLLIYHDNKAMGSRSIYRLGVALSVCDDPTKVIGRSKHWIFAEKADYEQRRLMPEVVFKCGAIVRRDELWVYYGAGDTCVGLAIGHLRSLLNLLI